MSGTLIDRALGRIAQDKQLHGLWLFFATTVLLSFAPLRITLVATLSVVLLKEYLDGNSNSKKEHINDIIAGCTGIMAACVVHYHYFIGG